MNSNKKGPLAAASVFGFLGVALGAFGAHALSSFLSPQALDWWHAAVEYHLIHAVALLVVALSPPESRSHALSVWAFSLGIVLFSGSLYALALTGQKWLGLVTPLGGIAFLVGWACLGLSLYIQPRRG